LSASQNRSLWRNHQKPENKAKNANINKPKVFYILQNVKDLLSDVNIFLIFLKKILGNSSPSAGFYQLPLAGGVMQDSLVIYFSFSHIFW